MTPLPPQFHFRNACTEECDMFDGPCCCGAWHHPNDWPQEVRDAVISKQLKSSPQQPRRTLAVERKEAP